MSPLRKGAVTVKEKGDDTEDGSFLQKSLFFVEPEVNVFYFGGRMILGLIIFIWGWKFIFVLMVTNDVGNSFLHFVNFFFYEVGHIFF